MKNLIKTKKKNKGLFIVLIVLVFLYVLISVYPNKNYFERQTKSNEFLQYRVVDEDRGFKISLEQGLMPPYNDNMKRESVYKIQHYFNIDIKNIANQVVYFPPILVNITDNLGNQYYALSSPYYGNCFVFKIEPQQNLNLKLVAYSEHSIDPKEIVNKIKVLKINSVVIATKSFKNFYCPQSLLTISGEEVYSNYLP